MIVAQIEGLAAREAAGKSKAVRLAMTRDMRQLNAQFSKAAQVRLPDSDRLHDLDDAFHQRYVDVGAGPRLRVLHNAVKPQAERYGRIYTSTLVSEVKTSVAEHEAIIKALEAGDASQGAARRADELGECGGAAGARDQRGGGARGLVAVRLGTARNQRVCVDVPRNCRSK